MKFKGTFKTRLAVGTSALFTATALPAREPQAPPPNGPGWTANAAAAQPLLRQAAAEPGLYSIGKPSAEEQQYLEFINQARANPSQEGLRLAQSTDPDILGAYDYFNVDLTQLVAQFSLIEPAPPLAFNEKLILAARGHSQEMFDHAFQSHDSLNGDKLPDRVRAEGYSYSTIKENVFSYSESVFFGHAGFNVDWGNGPYGMQTPPGHRNAIHDSTLREVGVGVVLGTKTVNGNTVGPQVVTQDFGTQLGATPLITGVAYYDANGNNFYDLGEGIGDVNVSVNGQLRAVTAVSGGYTVPVSGSGTYVVTFSGEGFAAQDQTATVHLGKNVKVDFKPAYTPPVLVGTANPGTNVVNVYTVTPVPGATLYELRKFDKLPPRLEGGEEGLNRVTVNELPYEILTGVIKKSGEASFHFAHPVINQAVVKPMLTVQAKYLARADTKLTYQSRFARATTDEKAIVQVSADNGTTWQTVETQIGTGGAGEAIFTLREVELGQYAGKEIQVRFLFETNPGQISIYPVADGTGWYVDDILMVNAHEIAGNSIQSLVGNTFEFQPPAVASYSLQVRARVGHYFLPWGPERTVTSVPELLEFDIVSIRATSGNFVHINFEVTAGTAPAGFTLQGRSTIDGEWTNEPIAVQKVSATEYRYVVPKNVEAKRFFRVMAN